MVAYNFKSSFVDPIRSGAKRQTIRRNGKRRHARPGEQLQLYTGMRTKQCTKIIDDPICFFAVPISIHLEVSEAGELGGITRIVCGTLPITTEVELQVFAQKDGFASLDVMSRFWRQFHGESQFQGTLIGWDL